MRQASNIAFSFYFWVRTKGAGHMELKDYAIAGVSLFIEVFLVGLLWLMT